MDIVILNKIISFIMIMFIGAIGTYIPIYLGNLNPTLLQYINVFSGGTLVTLVLCHLVPEAERLSQLINLRCYIMGTEIPIVSYLTLFGLTLILFFEKALFSSKTVAQFHMHDHSFPHRRDHHHHHHEDPGCRGSINESLSNEVTSSCETMTLNIPQSNISGVNIITPLIPQVSYTSTSNLYFLVSALSVHSVFEGILVGISKSTASVIMTTFIIITHKWIEGIAVAAGINKHSEISKTTARQLLASFVLMSPLGIILGQIFSLLNSPLLIVILICISSGALLYVALAEMVIDEFSCGENRKQKFSVFILGIILVSIINIIQHKFGGCNYQDYSNIGDLHINHYNHNHH
ncbi:zinc transporter [Cryptosporidium andersoni]|uniref:Zinc transporter n=1 Tax=Cryptosporidium andersoni TaxID=117008 RepID=A0A1J4MTK5_9CRYT|nr:zinc transporter [Cryptosporidium andersoni]